MHQNNQDPAVRQQETACHICPIIVRYAETDQMGIAHHANYPIWYEAARTEFIKQIGITYSQMEEMGILLPLIELDCKYKGAARYEDKLEVEVRVEQVTRVRIIFAYVIRKKGQDKPINSGHTAHAFVNRQMKPVNLEKVQPDLYQSLSALAEK